MKGKFRFVSVVSRFERCWFLFPTIRAFASIMIPSRPWVFCVLCSLKWRTRTKIEPTSNPTVALADSAPEPEEAALVLFGS